MNLSSGLRYRATAGRPRLRRVYIRWMGGRAFLQLLSTLCVMTLRVEIPGRASFELEYLLLDVNGTLTRHGALLDGVEERVRRIRDQLEVRLLSADTFGTLADVAAALGLSATLAPSRTAKQREISALGANRCAAIGNGANDVAMLAEAALGIAVIGPEGAAAPLLAAADLVTRSITEALDLLLEPRALAASLRS